MATARTPGRGTREDAAIQAAAAPLLDVWIPRPGVEGGSRGRLNALLTTTCGAKDGLRLKVGFGAFQAALFDVLDLNRPPGEALGE